MKVTITLSDAEVREAVLVRVRELLRALVMQPLSGDNVTVLGGSDESAKFEVEFHVRERPA